MIRRSKLLLLVGLASGGSLGCQGVANPGETGETGDLSDGTTAGDSGTANDVSTSGSAGGGDGDGDGTGGGGTEGQSTGGESGGGTGDDGGGTGGTGGRGGSEGDGDSDGDAGTTGGGVDPEPPTAYPDEDPGSFLMVNCNNAGEPDRPTKLASALARINFAGDYGIGWARVSGGPVQWYTGGVPRPERFEPVIELANARGVDVFLFLEYRPDIDGGSVYDYDWFETGRQFALMYGDRIGAYGLLNEVDHNNAVMGGLTPEHVADAVSDFSDGVRSVDAGFTIVSPSIGGTPMTPGQEIPFLQALAPMINDGRVDVLNLHTYIDARSPCNGGPHWSSYYTNGDYAAPHENFEWHKQDAGIDVDVALGAGEFNYREWQPEGCLDWGTWERRGVGFLTTLWSQLSAVHADGTHAASFHGPFDIFRAEAHRPYSMALEFDSSDPENYVWTPNPMGEVFTRFLDLTDGMKFVGHDPHGTGSSVLRGDGKKMWVWFNLEGFSSLFGADAIEITGVPGDAETLDVYTWENAPGSPAVSFPTAGADRVVIPVSALPDLPQTLMFVAPSQSDGGVAGGITLP